MSRTVMNMDFSWKFHRGEIDMGNKSSHSLDYASCKAGNAKEIGRASCRERV